MGLENKPGMEMEPASTEATESETEGVLEEFRPKEPAEHTEQLKAMWEAEKKKEGFQPKPETWANREQDH